MIIIFSIHNRETGYGGGGRRSEPWWTQTSAQKNLSETLEDILETSRERRWESRRRGKGGGGSEVEESDSGIKGPWYDGTDTGDARVGE